PGDSGLAAAARRSRHDRRRRARLGAQARRPRLKESANSRGRRARACAFARVRGAQSCKIAFRPLPRGAAFGLIRTSVDSQQGGFEMKRLSMALTAAGLLALAGCGSTATNNTAANDTLPDTY